MIQAWEFSFPNLPGKHILHPRDLPKTNSDLSTTEHVGLDCFQQESVIAAWPHSWACLSQRGWVVHSYAALETKDLLHIFLWGLQEKPALTFRWTVLLWPRGLPAAAGLRQVHPDHHKHVSGSESTLSRHLLCFTSNTSEIKGGEFISTTVLQPSAQL